jgi:hypothetical protein
MLCYTLTQSNEQCAARQIAGAAGTLYLLFVDMFELRAHAYA